MPTTIPTLWTPEAVLWVVTGIITVFAATLVPALIALIKALGALHVSKTANDKADANARAMDGMQAQITAVALQTPPPASPPVSGPVIPVKFVPPNGDSK